MNIDLPELQKDLFVLMKRIIKEDLKGGELDEEIKRSYAFNDLARTAVANGALMSKCADTLSGITVSDKVPLIPFPEEETCSAAGKRRALISAPKLRDDGCGAFRRGGSARVHL